MFTGNENLPTFQWIRESNGHNAYALAWAMLILYPGFGRAFVAVERSPRFFRAMASRPRTDLLLMVMSCIGGIRMKYVDRLYSLNGRTASFLPTFRNTFPIFLSLLGLLPTECPVDEVFVPAHNVPDVTAECRTPVVGIEIVPELTFASQLFQEGHETVIKRIRYLGHVKVYCSTEGQR